MSGPAPARRTGNDDPDRTCVVTGMSVASALGHGTGPLFAAALAGAPAFAPVRRFGVAGRRVTTAATMPGAPSLAGELAAAVEDACAGAGLTAGERAGAPLLLAVHSPPGQDTAPPADRPPGTVADPTRPAGDGTTGAVATGTAAAVATRPATIETAEEFARQLAAGAGLSGTARAYPSACVAASTALADAGAMVRLGRAERVVVAAGYLVDAQQFALFDAGRVLAVDGQVRPFSARRTGLLLGDGIAAVVLESRAAADRRGATVLARLAGWGRAGDAYHVCRPRPDGAGLARAIGAALARARIPADQVGYVNAHGSGTRHSDAAEAAALCRALGGMAGQVPVSSTKAVHGQALEASALLEFVVTVLALRRGLLPVNAGYLGPDRDCPLDVIVRGPREVRPRYALSLNSAFGGANTALLVGAP